MTNEDWKKVDNALKSVFSPGAKLLSDGYEVTLILCQKSQFQNAIAVYINGGFKANGSLKTARNAGVSSAAKSEPL